MGKLYNHLSLEERDKITVMQSEGKAISEIAGVIGRNKGTISRKFRFLFSILYFSTFLSLQDNELTHNSLLILNL